MSNTFFKFKQFTIHQERCAMKVTTDACVFGAWVARQIQESGLSLRNMLDIGTGTGLLTLMVAQKNQGLIIDAVEIDKAAFEQARENIRAAQFSNKIYLAHADILHQHPERKYDIIISNPPFYENELRSLSKTKNTAHHDESLSFDKLLPLIKSSLFAESRFYLLFPYKRRKEIDQLLKLNVLYIRKLVRLSQTANHEPIRVMIEGSLYQDYPPEEGDLYICDQKNHFTPGFEKLLGDYYLKL